jgi:uncharacterized protein (DUF433 family)
MGRILDSDKQDDSTVCRLASISVDGIPKIAAPEDPRRMMGRDPSREGGDRSFEAFAGAIRQDLAPHGPLERVLADRLILSAWTLQTVAEEELAAMCDPREAHRRDELEDPDRRSSSGRQVDTSPRAIFLVTSCLEKTIDLFRRLRESDPTGWGRPAPTVTRGAKPVAQDVDPDRDGKDRYDFSNEWPVVPRGRRVARRADADEPKPGPTAEPVLDRRWHDRLAFDTNVSEHSPVVKGTWVTVGHVVSLIVDGWSWSEILRTHPELNVDDIRTCLSYTVAEGDGAL